MKKMLFAAIFMAGAATAVTKTSAVRKSAPAVIKKTPQVECMPTKDGDIGQGD